MAGRFDLYINQGATFTLPLTIKNSDGTAFILTAWTIMRGQIRKSHKSTTIVKSFTCSKPTPPGADGRITLTLSAVDTGLIPAGETVNDLRSKYVWDLEIENSSSGEVKRLLEGYIYISPQVTR